MWIDDSYTINNSAGYNFKNTKSTEVKYFGSPVPRDESKAQVEIQKGATTVRARAAANGNILGYMNQGIYNILEVKNTNGFTWYKVEESLWFAYNPDWAIIHYPKNNDLSAEKLQKELAEKEKIINNLSAGVTELTNTIIDKDKEISALKEQLAIAPKLIFESTKLDYYAIKLDKNQKLYLG